MPEAWPARDALLREASQDAVRGIQNRLFGGAGSPVQQSFDLGAIDPGAGDLTVARGTVARMSGYSDEAVAGLDACGVRVVDRERVAAVQDAMPSAEDVEQVADVFALLGDPPGSGSWWRCWQAARCASATWLLPRR